MGQNWGLGQNWGDEVLVVVSVLRFKAIFLYTCGMHCLISCGVLH